jgi:hypothetical protein
MKSSIGDILRFVLEHSGNDPLARQAELCRQLAKTCGNETDAVRLHEISSQLLRVERLCHALKIRVYQQYTSNPQKHNTRRLQ